jgi:tol-pal system protein YbgF
MQKKFLTILILLILVSPPIAADNLRTRIDRLEQAQSQLREVIFNQTLKISEQQREIQILQGDIELLNYHLEQFKQSQAEKLLALEKRLTQQSAPVKSTTISEPEPEPVTSTPPTYKAPIVYNKTITYQDIVAAIQAENYEKVITSSKQFLKLYPQNPQADEVQFWLGQAYYVLKRLNSALTAFSILLEKYPNSPRNAEALLKIGYIYYDKHDYATAQAIFQQIKETYPNTSVAQFARQRQQEIRNKGY